MAAEGVLRQIIARMAFEVEGQDKLDAAEKKTDRFSDKLKKITDQVVGFLVADKIKDFVANLLDTADRLNDLSDVLGVDTKAIQQWETAAKFAGASSDDISQAFQTIKHNAAKASEGNAELSNAFGVLGSSIYDANGQIKSSPELLKESLKALSAIDDPAKRSALSLELLGKSGPKLLPLVKDGAKGLDDLLGKLDALGGGFSEDALEMAGELGDKVDEFTISLDALKNRLVIGLFPSLSWLIDTGKDLVLWFQDAAKNTKIFEGALLSLSYLAIRQAIKTYAAYLPWIALFALIFAIVDDVLILFDGGESVIGKFIDSIFGVGSAAKVVKALKDAWDALFGGLDMYTSFGDKVKAVFGRIGKFVGEFFVWLWEKLKSLASDLWDWFADLGASIVDKIIEGLKGSWEDLKQVFADLGVDLINAFKELFGIEVTAEAKLAIQQNKMILQRNISDAFPAISSDEDIPSTMFSGPTNTALIQNPSVLNSSSSTIEINTTNTNEFVFGAEPSTSTLEAIKSTMSAQQSEDRTATLAALESVAP